jgi:hypothetical protein
MYQTLRKQPVSIARGHVRCLSFPSKMHMMESSFVSIDLHTLHQERILKKQGTLVAGDVRLPGLRLRLRYPVKLRQSRWHGLPVTRIAVTDAEMFLPIRCTKFLRSATFDNLKVCNHQESIWHESHFVRLLVRFLPYLSAIALRYGQIVNFTDFERPCRINFFLLPSRQLSEFEIQIADENEQNLQPLIEEVVCQLSAKANIRSFRADLEQNAKMFLFPVANALFATVHCLQLVLNPH